MSHIINSRERNQSFIRFLIFYLITTALLVSAIYVDFKMLPSRETEFWKDEAMQFRVRNHNQHLFVEQMEKTKVLLDSLTIGDKLQVAYDIKWRGNMTDLEKLKIEDSSTVSRLNSMVITSFIELQQLKKEMIGLRELAADAKDLEAKLSQCQTHLNGYISAQSVTQP